MKRWQTTLMFFALALAAVSPTRTLGAGLLDFETRPDSSVPADNALLNVPYAISGGTVRLFFDMNGNNRYDPGIDQNPAFERTGNDVQRGFVSNFGDIASTIEDTARPRYEDDLGSFFLRQTSVPFGSFIALYDTTERITEFSGEIWDIDAVDGFTEQWRVDVLNGADGVLASMWSPVGTNIGPDSYDARPWRFEFHDLPPGVAKIKLTFVGTKPLDIVGLGFNNFSPTVAVPEPASFGLAAMGVGLIGTGMLFRERRSKKRFAGA